jgi:hypothetical protein
MAGTTLGPSQYLISHGERCDSVADGVHDAGEVTSLA